MPPKQALISSFLVKFTPEEKAERTAETFARIGEDSAKRKAKAKFALQTKANKERFQARARQQKRRVQLKDAEIASGIRDARTGQLIKEAKLSDKVAKQKRKLEPNLKHKLKGKGVRSKQAHEKATKNNPKPRQREKRKNWFSPELWPGIEEAQRFVGVWRAQAIVKHLQASPTGQTLYGSLDRGTVGKWFQDVNGETRWSEKTMKKVEDERRRVSERALGRPRILGLGGLNNHVDQGRRASPSSTPPPHPLRPSPHGQGHLEKIIRRPGVAKPPATATGHRNSSESVKPLAASVRPLAASIKPLAAPIDPLTASIEPLATSIEPLAASVKADPYHALQWQGLTLGSLLIAPEQLTVVRGAPIDYGDRSHIFLAKLNESPGVSIVAVKQLVREGKGFSGRYRLNRASIINALKVWQGLKHPNVLQLLGCSLNPNGEIYRLILPLLNHRNVREYLAKGTAGIAQRLKFAQDVAVGLDYLHNQSPPICRSNLNPLGILIDNNLNAVLGPFASFELYYDDADLSEDHRFTSPEVVAEGSAILTGYQPFNEAPSSTAVLVSMINRTVPGLPGLLLGLVPDAPKPEYASTLRLLYSYLPLCWEYEPRKRAPISLIRWQAFMFSFDVEAGDSVVATLEKLAHLLIPPDCLQIIQGSQLGAGNYGEVFLGTLDSDEESSTPRDVAVKRLKAVETRGERVRLVKRLARELKVWAKIRHPNVVELIGYCLDENYESPLLISALVPNGNVLEYIKRVKPGTKQKIGLVKGITAGLAYLHNFDPAICHADLKPANVLIDLNMNAVLCDFGLALFIGGSATSRGLATTTTLRGTPRYMSPELQLENDRTHSLESDVWAWACTVFEVLTGTYPYKELPIRRVAIALDQKKPPGDVDVLFSCNVEDMDTESASALKILHSTLPKCWAFEPQLRPTMRTVLSQIFNFASDVASAVDTNTEIGSTDSRGRATHTKTSENPSEGRTNHDVGAHGPDQATFPVDAVLENLRNRVGPSSSEDNDEDEDVRRVTARAEGSSGGITRAEEDEERDIKTLQAQLLALAAAIGEGSSTAGSDVPHQDRARIRRIREALGDTWESQLTKVLQDVDPDDKNGSTTTRPTNSEEGQASQYTSTSNPSL